MTRILTTCTLVLALALPAPLAAEGFDQEDVGKALFAALAAFVVGKMISDARDEDGAREASARIGAQEVPSRPEPPVVQHERGGLPTDDRRPVDRGGLPEGRIGGTDRLLNPPREVPDQRLGAARTPARGSPFDGYPLPATCRLLRGSYDAECLLDRLPVLAPLPDACLDRTLIDGRVRNTFDAACLREAGYRTPRD